MACSVLLNKLPIHRKLAWPCPQQGAGPGLGGRVPGQAVLHAHSVVQLLQLGGQRDAQLAQVQRQGLEGVLQFGECRPRKTKGLEAGETWVGPWAGVEGTQACGLTTF